MKIRLASNPFRTTASAMPACQSASIGALQTPWFASTVRVRQSELRCRCSAHAAVRCYFADFKLRCIGSHRQLGFCVPSGKAIFADNGGITLPTSPPMPSPNLNAPSQVPRAQPAPPLPTTATSTPAPSPNAPPPPSPPSHPPTTPTSQQTLPQPPPRPRQPSTPSKDGATGAATPTP